MDKFGGNPVDKEESTASDSYVSPYLLRPLRSISQAMKDRVAKLSPPRGGFEAANPDQPQKGTTTSPQPAPSPRSAVRSGATVVWLPKRPVTAGPTGIPEP